MILTILNLIIVSLVLWLPLFAYGRRSRRMVVFCQRMARSENNRKLFGYGLLILVLMFHATYHGICMGDFGPYASTAIALWLVSPKRIIRLLRDIRASQSVLAFIGILALIATLAPGMYSVGVTLGYVLLAAVFYPSKTIEEHVKDNPVYTNYDELEEETVKRYFA